MNRLKIKLIFVSLYSLFFILYSIPALAQTQPTYVTPTPYELLAPIPLNGPDAGNTTVTTTKDYLPGLVKLVIAIAGALAVVRIIFGGIKYMSTDAFTGKEEAKGTISNALWGLGLVMSAWLILYTINPKLVEINLTIPPLEISTPTPGVGVTGGVPMTPAEIVADGSVRTRLINAGVAINAGPCLQGQGYGCTNLNGLGEGAIQGLISLKSDCGCNITVTGGTEPGPHRTHGAGESIVDLANDSSLRSWLSSRNFLINNGNGAVVRLRSGRQVSFVFESAGEGRSTGDHWHVVF